MAYDPVTNDDAQITAEDVRSDVIDVQRRLQDIAHNPGGMYTITEELIPRIRANLDALEQMVWAIQEYQEEMEYIDSRIGPG